MESGGYPGELMTYTSSGDDYMTDISKMFQGKITKHEFSVLEAEQRKW